jgi:hypothetical protein
MLTYIPHAELEIVPRKAATSGVRNRTLTFAVARGSSFGTRGCPNMRQLPEDRINSALAYASGAHRFVAEIEELITRARRLVKLRPRERKKLRKSPPRKSCAAPGL